MRGKIIMWNVDKGIIAADDKQHNFDIQIWRGDRAPQPDMTVELTLDEAGTPVGVVPVSDADLAKETIGRLGGKGSQTAKAILGTVGMGAVIGYAIFLIAGMFFSVMSGKGMLGGFSVSLADLLSGNSGLNALVGGGSAKGVFLLLLVTATVVVPHYWKHRAAPLAFAAPLLVTLYGLVPVLRAFSQQRAQIAQTKAMLGGLGGEDMSAFESPVGLGFGAYVVMAAAIFLAVVGVRRFLRAKKSSTL